EAGGVPAGTRGVGAGMRGAGGWDKGIGMVCGGATGSDGLTSAGVFPAAGRTGFGSTGAGATGSFCAGVLAGTIGTGAGASGAGSYGFCSGCGSGLFSGTGNDIAAGSLTGTDKSTRGAGTCVSFVAGGTGAAGRCAASTTTGAEGRAGALSWRLRSATSR